MKNLDKLFKPKTIAVVGASDSKGSVGKALMDNLVDGGYKGKIFPISIKRKKIKNIKARKSIKDIPEKVDLAIIATPAGTVLEIIKDCGRAGVGSAIIISSGFSETGRKGAAMSERILETARKFNIKILGPNCLGFIIPSINLNASFASQTALPGRIAFISQSGALCTSILDWSIKNNVGFSCFVSIGEMLDIGLHDLIDYFGRDPNTSSILIYMESLKEAKKFISAARAFSMTKPIVVLKVGRSQEGALAAKSHTGSITGNDEVFSAAFERSGIVRVETVDGLFYTAKLLAMQNRPENNRLAVITNAGGPGVIAADAIAHSSARLASLEKKTVKKLNNILPPAWSKRNPVDLLGDADHLRYRDAVKICLEDKNVDGALAILTPQAMTDPDAIAKELVNISKNTKKILIASWMGGDSVAKGIKRLETGNVPAYLSPEDAVSSFASVFGYSENQNILSETPSTIPHAFSPKTKKSRELIDSITRDDRDSLTEAEAKELLANYKIPVAENGIAKTSREAVKMAFNLGFPVAMKILSPDITHKTDVGGVKLNVSSKKEANKAFEDIISSAKRHNPQADIHGVFIEKMINKKYELILGCKKDPIFGPALVFGMGGLAVEIFKDIRVGLPPLNMSLSMRMIANTKIYKMLKGFRNMPGVDLQSIQFLLYKFSYLIVDFPEIKEFDINPFAVDEHGGIVLDAKVILDKKIIKEGSKPYSHLAISPYPREYVIKYKLKNGQNIKIRPIRPEDEPIWVEMFNNFSKKTLRQRFLGQTGKASSYMRQRCKNVDYGREVVLVARIKNKKSFTGSIEAKMIGVVELVSNPLGKGAEFTIAIADRWQNLGLEDKFTDYILEIAGKRKIKNIYAKFLKDNKVMLHIFKKKGFNIFDEGKIYRAEFFTK
ncbi:MAG: GNAT family N-acetyltransferase [Patescibacteria group bacterium]|nr:GNAT family N-acetyltransferase [Patescibacteria group bacterium]